MAYVVTNVSDRAVGLPGGVTLQPGESAEFVDLSSADLKALKGFQRVKVSDVDRPASSRHKKPAPEA